MLAFTWLLSRPIIFKAADSDHLWISPEDENVGNLKEFLIDDSDNQVYHCLIVISHLCLRYHQAQNLDGVLIRSRYPLVI